MMFRMAVSRSMPLFRAIDTSFLWCFLDIMFQYSCILNSPFRTKKAPWDSSRKAYLPIQWNGLCYMILSSPLNRHRSQKLLSLHALQINLWSTSLPTLSWASQAPMQSVSELRCNSGWVQVCMPMVHLLSFKKPLFVKIDSWRYFPASLSLIFAPPAEAIIPVADEAHCISGISN